MRFRDHLDDPGYHKLNWLRANFELPDFVKTAEIEDDRDAIAREHFAYPENREFPTHSRADAWMSARLFQKHADEFEPGLRETIAQRLLDACRFWDARGGDRAVEKEADAGFDVEYPDADGEQLAKVSLRTAADFVKIATDLVDNKFNYPYATRNAVARRLLDAPAELASAMTSTLRRSLEKTAGLQRTSVGELRRTATVRAFAYRNKGRADLATEVLSAFDKTAGEAIHGVVPKQALARFAGSVDSFDRLVRLHMTGGHGLAPAEDSWKSLTLSDVSDIGKEAVTLPNGYVVVADDLRAGASEVQSTMRDLFGIEPRGDVVEKVASLTSEQCNQLFGVLDRNAPRVYSLERLKGK